MIGPTNIKARRVPNPWADTELMIDVVKISCSRFYESISVGQELNNKAIINAIV